MRLLLIVLLAIVLNGIAVWEHGPQRIVVLIRALQEIALLPVLRPAERSAMKTQTVHCPMPAETFQAAHRAPLFNGKSLQVTNVTAVVCVITHQHAMMQMI